MQNPPGKGGHENGEEKYLMNLKMTRPGCTPATSQYNMDLTYSKGTPLDYICQEKFQFLTDFYNGEFSKHGVRETACGLEPLAEDDTTEEYRQQQGKIWIYEGWSVEQVRETLARVRRELKELEAEEQREKRRKIITHRCKDDLSALKKLLPEYLRLKGVQYDPRRKTWRCPNHDDKTPSAHGYFKQESPVLYCPVCNKCFDIFNIAGLLIGSSDFKMQIADVKKTMGVI